MAIRRHPQDKGFTLVELLVVIVVLGVLATITVFAVRGITDQGSVAAQDSDEHILTVAEEAHLARFNSYADEDTLVTAGLLTSESTQHDIELVSGGDSYSIVPEGTATTTPVTTEPGGSTVTTEPPEPTVTTEPTVPSTVPPTAQPTTFAGFSGQSFGSGANLIVVITDTSKMHSGFDAFVAAGVPLPTTRLIFLGAGDVETTADVDAIIAGGATDFVAADSVPITRPGGGTTYVGQYLDDGPLPNDRFWWGHSQGSFNEMLDHYTSEIVQNG
jgi:prepilin-type N-terminal cleavage/methylation domain-containing protein